jgi:hypothetical protein
MQEHGLGEIFQPHHTHEDGLTRSRLDRIYVNHHATDTLHKECKAWAKPFRLELSHHRPVCFTRRSKQAASNMAGTKSPLPMLGINHSLFRSRLEEEWESKANRYTDQTPLQQLQSYKKGDAKNCL